MTMKNDTDFQKKGKDQFHDGNRYNGRKLAPTLTKTGISCHELAVHFLAWAEKYYVKNGTPTETFGHIRKALALLIHHYGRESVNNFAPLSLVFLQDQWVEQGYARLTVNRYVCTVKQAFRFGVKYGWVDAQIHHGLQAVDNLKKGRTAAREYKDVTSVDNERVERTLPFLPSIVADMVRVQRLCGMRPEDVRHMRSCDIDRTDDIWVYSPFSHKTEHHGHKLVKAIGPRAQSILIPYLIEKEETPEAFLFSPKDTVRMQRIERRLKRKSLNKKGEVQPSHRNRSKPDAKRTPGDKYTKSSYAHAIKKACAKAGVPAWQANQLRHAAATEIATFASPLAAKEFLGHANLSTTEQFYIDELPELAKEVARKFG
jgi:integrase